MTTPASARKSYHLRRRKALIAAHPDIDVTELNDLLSGDKAPSREDVRTLLLATIIGELKPRHRGMPKARLVALATRDVDTCLARMESYAMDVTKLNEAQLIKLTVELTNWIDQALRVA